MMLFANGCSMTEGAELGGEELGPQGQFIRDLDPEYKTENAWPQKVASSLDMSCVNIAQGGASNEKITRTTIEWTADYLKENKAEDLFVVIGWSAPQRTEIKIGEQWFDFMPHHIPTNKKLKTVHDFYLDHIYDHISDYAKSLISVLSLQSWLKVNKIPYLFTNSLMLIYTEMPKTMLSMIDNIDSSRYYGYSDLKKNMMFKVTESYPRGPRNHTLAEGHAAWSLVLRTHINKNKWLLEHDNV